MYFNFSKPQYIVLQDHNGIPAQRSDVLWNKDMAVETCKKYVKDYNKKIKDPDYAWLIKYNVGCPYLIELVPKRIEINEDGPNEQ